MDVEVKITCDCGYSMGITIYFSAAGYYIGYFCKNCGPYHRLSGYYRTEKEALEDVPKYRQQEIEAFERWNGGKIS